MMAKAIFMFSGRAVLEYPIPYNEPGDLIAGAKEAFDAFERQFPDVSLIDNRVSVKFDTMEDQDA